jgi:hypothetical protein
MAALGGRDPSQESELGKEDHHGHQPGSGCSRGTGVASLPENWVPVGKRNGWHVMRTKCSLFRPDISRFRKPS